MVEAAIMLNSSSI